jgi:glycosyltransferase involved in cell wall biosynthesis
LKILMVFYDLHGAAGIQRVVSTLSNAFVASGVEVHIAVTSHDTTSFFPLDPGVKVATLAAPEPHSDRVLARWAKKARWAASAWSAVRRYVERHGVTHVIDHGTALGLLYPFSMIGGAHFVLCRHFPVKAFPRGGLLYRALKPLKRRTNVVVLTAPIAAELRGLGYGHVRVIPNPVQAASVRSAVAKDPVILAVGRDNPQKGFDVLLRAFAAVSATHPAMLLRIIGAGIPCSQTLTGLRAALGLVDRVFLEDARPDLAGAIDASQVVVLPSRYEALPMFLLEAMARGAAVVGTAVDGIRDFIRDGENGILVTPESPDALAQAIRRVLDDVDLRERISRNATASVAHLSPESVAGKWTDYLRELGA